MFGVNKTSESPGIAFNVNEESPPQIFNQKHFISCYESAVSFPRMYFSSPFLLYGTFYAILTLKRKKDVFSVL